MLDLRTLLTPFSAPSHCLFHAFKFYIILNLVDNIITLYSHSFRVTQIQLTLEQQGFELLESTRIHGVFSINIVPINK